MRAAPVVSIALVASSFLFPGPVHAETLEFALRAGASVPTEKHDDQPVAAPSGGLVALVQLNAHFAAGAQFETLWLSWHSPPGGDGRFDGPLEFPDDGTRSSLFALTGRFYPVRAVPLLPYVEASAGYASVSMPKELCNAGGGISGQLALGLDWQVAASTRLGIVTAARPFRSARACYPEGSSDPPDVALALSGQLALTTLWESK